jgi:hypothetical protein
MPIYWLNGQAKSPANQKYKQEAQAAGNIVVIRR